MGILTVTLIWIYLPRDKPAVGASVMLIAMQRLKHSRPGGKLVRSVTHAIDLYEWVFAATV
jgi:hypothetical protein